MENAKQSILDFNSQNSDLPRMTDLFLEWCQDNIDSETSKALIEWLESPQEEDFFNIHLDKVSDWIFEKDIKSFSEYVKEIDEALIKALSM